MVVPATSEGTDIARFEGRDVERSLASLQRSAGGTFAEESFEIPQVGEAADGTSRVGADDAGVTLPRWAIYALILAFPAVAAAAFLCGCLWTAAGRP